MCRLNIPFPVSSLRYVDVRFPRWFALQKKIQFCQHEFCTFSKSLGNMLVPYRWQKINFEHILSFGWTQCFCPNILFSFLPVNRTLYIYRFNVANEITNLFYHNDMNCVVGNCMHMRWCVLSYFLKNSNIRRWWDIVGKLLSEK